MEKINTDSLTELNGHTIELGITKIREKNYPPGMYLIPIFINKQTSLAQDKQGNVGAINTDKDWMIYDESKHSAENFEAISIEEFIKGLKEAEDACEYIHEEFNALMNQDQYDRVGEILDSTVLDEFSESGIGIWMLTAGDPVSPLLRPIPKEERVDSLNNARVRFYDKCIEFYTKDKGSKEEAEKLVGRNKPKDYDDRVAGFDALYMGGAPKEK